MLKRLFRILFLLPIFVAGSAYAVTCQSNEFEYNGECIENKFQITTTNDTNKFVFNMSAKGTFYIDWGDGNVEMINRTGTTMTEYTHNYASTNEYIIKFGGRATGYTTTSSYNSAAIRFGQGIAKIDSETNLATNNTFDKLAGIAGSLGAIFPTIDDGSSLAKQPSFESLFRNCTNLTGAIPDDLFSRIVNGVYEGVSGPMRSSMFMVTFTNSRFNSAIPETLFGRIVNGTYYGLTGRASNMFAKMFARCPTLTGTNIDDPNNPGMKYAIPPNLFYGLSGQLSNYELYCMFMRASGLSGTIPEDLLGREINGVYHGFNGTFAGETFISLFQECSGLTGPIPEKLFVRTINGVKYGHTGQPVGSAYRNTFYNCSGLTGPIPAKLFDGLSGSPRANLFYGTFYGCSGLTGPIPGNLFSGISGAPASNMFYGTFYGCSGLTGPIPSDLFNGISGKPSASIFQYTFAYCTGLSETDIDDPDNPGMKYAIPPNLFAGISGKPASAMFAQTFAGMSGLKGTIPKDLFKNISGAPAASMFTTLFAGCTGLKGSIPGTLFAGISGAPATGMFKTTFNGCNHLTGAIPADLFSGISGAPASEMFYQTFLNCSGLTGPIPGDLFSGLSGAPAASMFYHTFYNCSGLTGSIPGNLFSGISGQPKASMFYSTFRGCSSLTGPIPGNLFSGIVGKPANYMFYTTFYGCTNLGKDRIGGTSTYYVPPELFAGIDKNSTASSIMASIFYNTGLLTACPTGTSQYTTGFESYWNNKKSCTACPVEYPLYDSTNDTCYAQVTFIDSDNNALLKKEDVYYDGNNGSGYNLPSYSPVKPDTILTNWENGSGTVIGANDVLTGNQVLYSDWGFNCDSGRYFHIGNEQVCIAESKRTEHALVIQYDPEHTYYIHATPNSEHDYTINSSSIHKLKADYNGTIYNLHDASVYFDN